MQSLLKHLESAKLVVSEKHARKLCTLGKITIKGQNVRISQLSESVSDRTMVWVDGRALQVMNKDEPSCPIPPKKLPSIEYDHSPEDPGVMLSLSEVQTIVKALSDLSPHVGALKDLKKRFCQP